jgi:hypothetical protein
VIADSATIPHGGSYLRVNIIKLDNGGNIIWNRKYGQIEYENYLSNIHCLDDGSIICTGSVWTLHPWNVGWVLKLNADGDSLWYRQYHNISGQYSFNYLRDITITSNSGYAACGFVIPISPDTGIERVWVLKLDSLGCDTAGCDPTVGIPEEEEKGRGGEEERVIEVWPNPCSTALSISLTSRQSAVGSQQSVGRLDSWHLDKLMVEIYDIFGRKVSDKNTPLSLRGGTGGGVTMGVSALPPGLYMLIVKNEESIVGSAKFIVAR